MIYSLPLATVSARPRQTIEQNLVYEVLYKVDGSTGRCGSTGH